MLLLADDEPLLARVRGGDTAVMLELVDRAAVDLREPVRGLLWITGWLWLPEQRAARRMALQVADVRPQEGLLELGHGATLVRLDPGSAVLADGDGCAALTPVDMAAARPDPFCLMEDRWLAHLEAAHPEVFVGLAQHLPPELGRCRGARIRPLGVDRCGLRLRVETPAARPRRAPGVPERGLDARGAAGTAQPAGGTGQFCTDPPLKAPSMRSDGAELLREPVPTSGRGAPGAHVRAVVQPEPSTARPSRTRRVTWRSATNDAIGIVPASRITTASSGRQRQRSARISVQTM